MGRIDGWVDGWMGIASALHLVDKRTDDRMYSLKSLTIAVPCYSRHDPETHPEL